MANLAGGYLCPKLLTFEPKVVKKVHPRAEKVNPEKWRVTQNPAKLSLDHWIYPWTKDTLPGDVETHPGALESYPRALEPLPGSPRSNGISSWITVAHPGAIEGQLGAIVGQ